MPLRTLFNLIDLPPFSIPTSARNRTCSIQEKQAEQRAKMALRNNLAVCFAFMAVAAVPVLGAPVKYSGFATCADALANIPGYSYTVQLLQQCADLNAMQTDPNQEKTFFVPSNTAIENVAAQVGVPVEKIVGGDLKTVMCQVLKNHIVNGKHMMDAWKVGQSFNTMYFGGKINVKALGDAPQVKSAFSNVVTIDKEATCGKAVAYAIDSVLPPFPLPRLG